MKRLLGSFAVLGGATAITQLIGFAALALASRRLGPAALGAAAFALNLALYFALPANFGIGSLGVRDAARSRDRAREIAGEVLALRIGIAIPSALGLAVLSPLLGSDSTKQELILLAAITIVLGATSGEWLLFAIERRAAVGATRLAGQVVYAVLLILLLVGGMAGAELFVGLTALGVAVTTTTSLALAWRVLGPPLRPASIAALRRRLWEGAPLGVALVMVQVYLLLGTVMLSYIRDDRAVGQYTVALKIPLALYGLSDLWSATLYPRVVQLMRDDRRALARFVGQLMTGGLALALPLVAGGALLGSDLMPRLFGAAYRPAGASFAVLLGAVALTLVTVTAGSTLAAGGEERRFALALTAGAVANVAINAVTIPRFGPVGAAAATVAAEVMIFGFVYARFRAVVGSLPVDLRRLGRSALATAVMCCVVLLVPGHVDVLIRIVIGAAVYAVAALASGVVSRADLRALRQSPV